MKENKIEKLILDLSNRWKCTPQEAVDRLNSMNESEINKLIKSMAKKFQWGGELYNQLTFWEYLKQKQKEQVDVRRKRLDEMTERLQHAWDVVHQTPEEEVELPLALRDSVLREKIALDKELKALEQMKQIEEINSPFSFQNGGIMKCLKGGKTYAECKKCGGKTPVQTAGLGDILGRIFGKNESTETREPGTRPSSAGILQPDYVKQDDALWFDNNGARVRNHFVGNTLTQAFTTTGDYGKPILQYRIIENYDRPMPGDTSYVNGYGSRNVSEEYKRAADRRLQGAEPEARSASEVRAINRSNKTGVSANKCGGPLPKKSKFKK